MYHCCCRSWRKVFAASPSLFLDKHNGRYGNGLIDVAEKPEIPKRFLTAQVACYPKQPAVKIRCENISYLPLCIPFFDPALSLDNSLSTKTR